MHKIRCIVSDVAFVEIRLVKNVLNLTPGPIRPFLPPSPLSENVIGLLGGSFFNIFFITYESGEVLWDRVLHSRSLGVVNTRQQYQTSLSM